MDIKKINSNQNFNSAYAFVNGKWINLTRGGKTVTQQAVRKNIESHSLDTYIKWYIADKNGTVHQVLDKEWNNVIKTVGFNKYKKIKDLDLTKHMKEANYSVSYHMIAPSPTIAENGPIYTILTGKDAVQISNRDKSEKGKYILSLFQRANVDLGDRNKIKFDVAPELPNVPQFSKRIESQGAAWYEIARFNSVLKEAKEEAEMDKSLIITA